MKQAQVLLAEFLGTFALTFFGAGAILTDALLRGNAPFGPVDLLVVAFAHAVVLAVMVTAMGHISGGHFNPAVTVAAMVTRHIQPLLAGLYVVTQLVAGIAAALLLKYIFAAATVASAQLGAPGPGVGITSAKGYVIEVVLTFFLVLVVFATAIDPRGAFGKIAGFGIGFVLLFDILLGGPLTGAAMNPARAFGPALVGGLLTGDAVAAHFFMYWLGPLVGAALAALVYEALLMRDESVPTDVPPPSEDAAEEHAEAVT
ncbi:MAG: aquaporin [Chloroflexota bacterium]|jgi:aquaporin Z|nr:aquaporin [Chloroflexota bacterium]